MKALIVFTLFALLTLTKTAAQEPSRNEWSLSQKEAEKILSELTRKSESAGNDIDKATEKYLAKLLHQEQKIFKKLLTKDSLLAKELFSGVEEKYKRVASASGLANKYLQHYDGHLDSLSTALNFLKNGSLPLSPEKLEKATSQFSALQAKLNQTDKVKKFLAERRKLLSERLQSLGLVKQLNAFKKQAYYYTAQLNEYKSFFDDPSKWEHKLMELALNIPEFKKFFSQNSLLGSLFPLSGSSSGASTAVFQGLQSRNALQQSLQTRFGSSNGVAQILQANVQQAQGQIAELKTKLFTLEQGNFGNSGEVDLPKGFKPNSQKTKSLLQRLEYGANLQSNGARSFLPVTTDLGLSLGYKLSDNSSLGIGAAYTLGWGNNISRLRMTSEGMGLRSYLDLKIKGNLFVSGGYEMNYRPLVPQRIDLSSFLGTEVSSWQRSGLVGLSKKYKASKKLKGDIRLLWDFLSYTQVPRTQALVFRVGYSFK